MRLRLVRHPANADGSYQSDLGWWAAGEEREVPSPVAERLLADFGSAFEAVPEPAGTQPETRDELPPAADREVRPPKAARPRTGRKARS